MAEKELNRKVTKAEYDIQYAKDNIKRVPLDMRKADYEKLKAIADEKGEKVNQYIKKAIAERMERDNTGGGVLVLPGTSES